MAASVIGICNQALSRIGSTQFINALTDDTENARACNFWYEQCRDHLLTACWWPFATKTATLNQISGIEPLRREYGYTLPDDCLRVQEIWTGAVTTAPEARHPFEYEIYNGVRVLVTDLSEVDVTYTARVEDPVQFPPQFVDALAWSLAAELAQALEKGNRSEYARQRAALAVSSAVASLQNELTTEPEPEASSIRARG